MAKKIFSLRVCRSVTLVRKQKTNIYVVSQFVVFPNYIIDPVGSRLRCPTMIVSDARQSSIELLDIIVIGCDGTTG